jgi:hypothetical protein
MPNPLGRREPKAVGALALHAPFEVGRSACDHNGTRVGLTAGARDLAQASLSPSMTVAPAIARIVFRELAMGGPLAGWFAPPAIHTGGAPQKRAIRGPGSANAADVPLACLPFRSLDPPGCNAGGRLRLGRIPGRDPAWRLTATKDVGTDGSAASRRVTNEGRPWPPGRQRRGA